MQKKRVILKTVLLLQYPIPTMQKHNCLEPIASVWLLVLDLGPALNSFYWGYNVDLFEIIGVSRFICRPILGLGVTGEGVLQML